MNKKFNGTTVETNGVRTIEGGGTGATTASAALAALGGIAQNAEDDTPVNAIRAITQQEYDDLADGEALDPNTIYFIKQ